MKLRTFALLIIANVLGIVQPAFAFPLTVQHKQGSTIIEHAPKRVAVFDLAALDMMNALGVTAVGVPKAYMPQYLSYYSSDEFTKVGDLFTPDYETLKTLKPDLIVIAGRSARAYEELSKLAPTLDLTIDVSHFVQDMQHNLALLGTLFHQEKKAQELSIQLNNKLTALRTQAAQQGKALVLFTMNDNVMIHAPGERFGMLYELIGIPSTTPPIDPATIKPRAKPGTEEAKQQQQERQQRLKTALAENPSWIFVLDRGAATGGEGKARATLSALSRVTATTAWTQNQIYYLNPQEWYLVLGGYQSVLNTLNDLSTLFSESSL